MKINIEKFKGKVKKIMEECLEDGRLPDQQLIIPSIVISVKNLLEWHPFLTSVVLEIRNDQFEECRDKIKELNIPEYCLILPTLVSKDPPGSPKPNPEDKMGVVFLHYKKDLTMDEATYTYQVVNNKIVWDEKIGIPSSNEKGFSNFNFYLEEVSLDERKVDIEKKFGLDFYTPK